MRHTREAWKVSLCLVWTRVWASQPAFHSFASSWNTRRSCPILSFLAVVEDSRWLARGGKKTRPLIGPLKHFH